MKFTSFSNTFVVPPVVFTCMSAWCMTCVSFRVLSYTLNYTVITQKLKIIHIFLVEMRKQKKMEKYLIEVNVWGPYVSHDSWHSINRR